MSFEDKIKNAKPSKFIWNDVPDWKLSLWVRIGKLKGRFMFAWKYDKVNVIANIYAMIFILLGLYLCWIW